MEWKQIEFPIIQSFVSLISLRAYKLPCSFLFRFLYVRRKWPAQINVLVHFAWTRITSAFRIVIEKKGNHVIELNADACNDVVFFQLSVH